MAINTALEQFADKTARTTSSSNGGANSSADGYHFFGNKGGGGCYLALECALAANPIFLIVMGVAALATGMAFWLKTFQ